MKYIETFREGEKIADIYAKYATQIGHSTNGFIIALRCLSRSSEERWITSIFFF